MRDYIILRRGRSTRGDLGHRSADGLPTVVHERLDSRHAAQLAQDEEVAAIAPSMPIKLIAPRASAAGAGADAWGISAVGADRSPFDGEGVKIAVLDTGIDADHPAFEGITLEELDFSGSGDGDVHGHGTHCAGTIFGRDVGQRIGVARGVTRAWIGKVLDDSGQGNSDMVFNALHWALESKVNIISMSLGFNFPGMVEELVADNWPIPLATSEALVAFQSNLRMFDALMEASRAMGPLGHAPLVIAAAGNESRREVETRYRIAASLPAAANHVISVAAVGPAAPSHPIADFSNGFPTVAAPGVDILSAEAGGDGLVALSGTSMACPHAAGVAALWWQSLGRNAIAERVAANLRASCRLAPLGDDPDPADFGDGLITAPMQRA